MKTVKFLVFDDLVYTTRGGRQQRAHDVIADCSQQLLSSRQRSLCYFVCVNACFSLINDKSRFQLIERKSFQSVKIFFFISTTVIFLIIYIFHILLPFFLNLL